MRGALVLMLIFSFALCAQQPAQEENAIFRTGVSLVRVDAQVTAGKQPVEGLGKEDFVVMDNGAPQKIEYFGHEAEPVWVVLLLDVSGSMSKRLSEVAAVARQSLGSLKSGDHVAVILFGRNSRVAREFTDQPADAAPAIQEAVRERGLGAGSLINEAVIKAADYVREKAANQAGRRSIVILTDNQGLAYRVPDETVLKALFTSDAVLNAIVTPDARPPAARAGGNPDFTPHDVFKLARETGGEVLKSQRASESFQEMMERVRTRYSLHFRPAASANGALHSIQVTLSPEARRRYSKAEVRARTGYIHP